MACNITPTGPCSIASDGDPVSPKAYNASLTYTWTGAYGFSDHFTVEWLNTPSSTDEMTLLYREELATGFEEQRIVVPFDDGVISSATGYTTNTIFLWWLRRESSTEYGPWQTGFAICDAAWQHDIEVVKHLNRLVIHDGEIVIHTV